MACMASLAEKERRTDSKAELLHVLSATKQITAGFLVLIRGLVMLWNDAKMRIKTAMYSGYQAERRKMELTED